MLVHHRVTPSCSSEQYVTLVKTDNVQWTCTFQKLCFQWTLIFFSCIVFKGWEHCSVVRSFVLLLFFCPLSNVICWSCPGARNHYLNNSHCLISQFHIDKWITVRMGNRDSAVVRALAPLPMWHVCLSVAFVVGSCSCSKRFSSSNYGVPSPQKNIFTCMLRFDQES